MVLKLCLPLLEWINKFNQKWLLLLINMQAQILTVCVCTCARVCVCVMLAYSCAISFTQRVRKTARVQLNSHLVSNNVLKPTVLLHTFAYISRQRPSLCRLGKITIAYCFFKETPTYMLPHSQLSTRTHGSCRHDCPKEFYLEPLLSPRDLAPFFFDNFFEILASLKNRYLPVVVVRHDQLVAFC